ncbi:MAG: VacJ family lipoprotein [Pararhodobacter sp.]
MNGAQTVLGLGLGLVLAGCSLGPAETGTNDPHEATNRVWFERNLALTGALRRDEATLEPQADAETDEAAMAPADAMPEAAPVEEAPRRRRLGRLVSNFGGNLGLPSTILNDLLQIRPDRATENAIRLVINSTIGLGGLFDPAGAMGLHGRRTDFGETLFRWGVGEGAYVVLPLLGPSTERDALGMVVDLVIDPLRFVLPGDALTYAYTARAAARFADAAEYSDLLDANVINTADPYAQARLLYLQTRRYHLGAVAEEEIIDPYADF